MASSQRTEIAYSDLKLYKALGHLIKDYRKWRQLTQASFAELIGISVRELQYWEKGSRNAHISNLHDFSEITGIPMQVCVALNADQPVWYSLQKRVFAYSLLEASQLSGNDLLGGHQKGRDGIYTRDEPIESDKHISLILSCHRQIYGTDKLLGKDVIKAASTILPDLNRIIFDSWGHYVGHQICLPIKKDIYEQLKQHREFEPHLTPEAISDILSLNEGVFFSYSSFAVSISVAYPALIKTILYKTKIKEKQRYLIAFYPPSLQIKEFFKNLDLQLLLRKVSDGHGQANFVPSLYEIELDVMMRSLRPFLASLGHDTCD
ncbi:MAG: helix-turn-helix transcriptional regulator [Desulfobacterium sp.]|nr:helix-turn-helix transcriptional regulator [Desulfobacterium sp.]MBU3947005.1 helix-turn-helix domain-containing protein [Pseudomonadota bacterium]MBU4009397.1 helix-turn-helix domain-containing protein [Pseudomonadota bacterium]MBU4035929.1 helix-turn-helix domain-containing protein [Pseudomonadota bacterium]